MEFVPIFTKKKECKLWAVCYPEDRNGDKENDILNILFSERWDVQFIREFLKSNIKDLNTPFWDGLDIDKAITKIENERDDFLLEIYNIQKRMPGYEMTSIAEIFEKLHVKVDTLTTRNEDFRKAKPNISKAIIRLYAIELEDGTFIITGGTFKLTKDMVREHLVYEKKQLRRVKDYLISQDITDLNALITF